MGEVERDGDGAFVAGRTSYDGDGDGASRGSLVDGAEQAVRDWLAPGRFREGDRLPTEEQLAEMLRISRGTLRTALQRLDASGEIVRRQGSGTFVGQLPEPPGPGVVVPWLRADSYNAWAPAGPFSVRSMSVERVTVDESAALALALATGTEAVVIRRVVGAGGVPVAVAYDVLHPDLDLPDVESLQRVLRREGQVHAMVLAATGIAFSLTRTRISSVLVDPSDRVGDLLGFDAATACVRLEEVSIGAGRPIHWARDIVDPAHMEIEIVQSAAVARPAPVGGRAPSTT